MINQGNRWPHNAVHVLLGINKLQTPATTAATKPYTFV